MVVGSIAYGVIAGVLSYILLNGIPYILRKLTSDRIIPPNFDAAEPWVIPPGGIIPVWFQKLTGRYVDPATEMHMEGEGGDAMSMESTAHRQDTGVVRVLSKHGHHESLETEEGKL